MKKYLFLALGMAFICASCVKERTCSCTPAEGPNTGAEMLTVDGSIDCEDITTMGFDELVNGEYVSTVKKVKCAEFSVKK